MTSSSLRGRQRIHLAPLHHPVLLNMSSAHLCIHHYKVTITYVAVKMLHAHTTHTHTNTIQLFTRSTCVTTHTCFLPIHTITIGGVNLAYNLCFQEKLTLLMACDDGPVNKNLVGTIESAVYPHYVHTKQTNSFQ